MSETFAKDLAAIAKIDAVEKILEVVCRTTGLGFSAVARVTESHWIACAVRDEIAFGLRPGGELQVETTICDEIQETGKLVVIDHVDEDDCFRDHPTPKMYGFQSYISVPITLKDGQFFGTLCAIDPRPARVNTPEIIGMFTLFASLIAMHLEAQEQLAANEAALSAERETARLREQFIAVLGHDLRNPLWAVKSGTEVLRMMPHGPESEAVIDMIRRSATRMEGLINDVLDFARGRVDGGFPVTPTDKTDIGTALDQVVAELQSVHPEQTIEREYALDGGVRCDSERIAQMFSNLLANALAHGEGNSPIQVRATKLSDEFVLSVTNRGEPIAPHVREQLFEPFSRRSLDAGNQGLGLGLYISSEIARAHGGTLDVESGNGETCFSFRMPLQ